jgi:hypothetical protein
MDSNTQKTPALDLPSPALASDAQTVVATPQLPQQVDPQQLLVPANAVADLGVSAQVSQDDRKSDELDQEWVYKAKLIIEQTKHDPFLQNKQLSGLKAEYLKIRYNKDIKLSEEKT